MNGKYDSEMDEKVHAIVLDGFSTRTFGSIPEDGVIIDLLLFADPTEFGAEAAVVVEDEQGFVEVTYFDTAADGRQGFYEMVKGWDLGEEE